MSRRRFLAGAMALAADRVVVARAADGPVRRVGVLMWWKRGDAEALRVLRERLASAGFVEGSNLQISVETLEADEALAPVMAGRIVAGRPDVIYAMSEPNVDALKAITRTIPVVFVFVTEPVQRGYVRDYARPGGNITGVTDRYVETGTKRLELLREIAPAARRVAFVGDYGDTVGFDQWRQVSRRLGFSVVDCDLRSAPIDKLLADVKAKGAECLFPIGTLKTNDGKNGTPAFLAFAARQRMPAVYSVAEVVRRLGGLMSIELDPASAFQSAADMVVRILKGEKPETMPVREGDRFSLTVNLKTARAMGLQVPQAVLLRADEVIE